MPFSKEELIKIINLDEPDYASIVAKLTPADVPTLIELTKHENPAIATKAISCLGLMKTDQALSGIEEAIKHPDAVRRVAAAHSLQHMTALPRSVQLLDKLLDDGDVGVRKFALKTVQTANISSLKEKVRTMNLKEANPALKTLSQEILQKLK